MLTHLPATRGENAQHDEREEWQGEIDDFGHLEAAVPHRPGSLLPSSPWIGNQ
jgi:hypothetical protein